jgi:hypothetical protein
MWSCGHQKASAVPLPDDVASCAQVCRHCELAQAGTDMLGARASCCGKLTCVTLLVIVQAQVAPAASAVVSHVVSAYVTGAPPDRAKADSPTLPPFKIVTGQLTGVLPATTKQADTSSTIAARHVTCLLRTSASAAPHRPRAGSSPGAPKSKLCGQHAPSA